MIKIILALILISIFLGSETVAQKGPPSPEALMNYDKAFEEYLVKLAEVQEKNKQITENNEKIYQALSEGVKAYNNKDYKLAVKKFDEGFILDPDFWGSAPVLLSNKAMALRMIGTEKYNNALRLNLNPAFEANQYFLDAVSALKDAQKVLDEATIPTDETVKTTFEKIRYIAVKESVECYKLLVLTDKTRIYEAIEAFENYIKIENDELLKQNAQENLKKLKAQFNINY